MGKHPYAQWYEKVSYKGKEGNAQFPVKRNQLFGFGILLIELDLDWRTSEWRTLFHQVIGLARSTRRPIVLEAACFWFTGICVITIILNHFAFSGDASGYLSGFVKSAQAIDDENEGDNTHDHENNRLESIGICGSHWIPP